MKFSIKLLYLYLFSFIGLLIAVIGSIRITQLLIKVYVFHGADQYNLYSLPIVNPEGKQTPQTQAEKDEMKKANEEETKRQRQREISEAIAMIVVGTPLYLYHWKKIKD